MHKIFYIRIKVSFDGYKHHTINNCKQLIEEKECLKIISIIMTQILTTISMYIKKAGFWKLVRLR